MQLRSISRSAAVVVAITLLVIGWLWLALRSEPPAPDAPRASTAPSGVGASSAPPQGTDPWALLAAAEQAASHANPPLPTLKPSMSEADWQAYDRQWCAAMQPVRERLQKGQALASDVPMPTDEELTRAGQALAQRAGQVLIGRGDPRSRAVGLWLLGDTPALWAQAESSRDPMVAALAARTIKDKKLQARAAALWRHLEPDNLAAMLATPSLSDRIGNTLVPRTALATTNTNWQAEANRLLLSVAPPNTGGATELAYWIHITSMRGSLIGGSYLLLTRQCKTPASSAIAEQCARAANLLWEGRNDILLEGAIAIAMVRGQPALHPQWAERATQLDALNQVMPNPDPDLTRRKACLPDPEVDRVFTDLPVQGEKAFLESRLPKDPAAVEALAKQTRSTRGGRSRLDLEPKPPSPR